MTLQTGLFEEKQRVNGLFRATFALNKPVLAPSQARRASLDARRALELGQRAQERARRSGLPAGTGGVPHEPARLHASAARGAAMAATSRPERGGQVAHLHQPRASGAERQGADGVGEAEAQAGESRFGTATGGVGRYSI